jgi:anaerobic magnesium-protoporphyrin IX monomethyl ester cyclase
MKVLLFNVPIWKMNGFSSAYNPGMGLLYIGAILREKGHTVRIIDAEAARLWHEDLLDIIEDWKPTHIGLSCLSNGLKSGIELTHKIKERFPLIWVAMGGVGPSAMPTYTLKKAKCDSVTVGESELVLDDSFSKCGIIQGISPDDLDSLPFPAYDLMEPRIGEVRDGAWRGNLPVPEIKDSINETVVMWSRGCPHACTFCSKATMPRKYPRLRSPENIVKELEMLNDKFNVNSIFVYDDELIGMGEKHNEWIISVCNAIEKSKIHDKIQFKGQGRCNKKFITEEVVKSLKRAGFFAMMMGCESGSEKVKQVIRKGTTNEDIRHSLKIIHDNGLKIYGFWMVGLPQETPKEIHETEELIKEVTPYMDWFSVGIFSPLPGSDFWDEAVDKKWFRITLDGIPGSNQSFYEDFLDIYFDISHADFQQFPLLNMPWMNPDDIIKHHKKLFTIFDAVKEGRI